MLTGRGVEGVLCKVSVRWIACRGVSTIAGRGSGKVRGCRRRWDGREPRHQSRWHAVNTGDFHEHYKIHGRPSCCWLGDILLHISLPYTRCWMYDCSKFLRVILSMHLMIPYLKLMYLRYECTYTPNVTRHDQRRWIKYRNLFSFYWSHLDGCDARERVRCYVLLLFAESAKIKDRMVIRFGPNLENN